jgi:hypothetical protein
VAGPIELTSVYLGGNVAAVLARTPEVTASPQQKQDLAAFIHLCGTAANCSGQHAWRSLIDARRAYSSS